MARNGDDTTRMVRLSAGDIMMLSIMCALWVSSACAQIDIRNADTAIGTCRLEMMKAAREQNEFNFMRWCMQSHGLYFHVHVGNRCMPPSFFPNVSPQLDDANCWRRVRQI